MTEVLLPQTAYKKKLTSRAIGGKEFEIQVPPTIIPGAKVTFCGESPGYNEVMERKGFVGGSGNVLWKMARGAGIDPESVNRSNVAKRRPTDDDFGCFYHDPRSRQQPTEELIFWRELLIKELEKYTPNVFVAVGDEALKAVCPSLAQRHKVVSGRKAPSIIGMYRGSILDCEVVKGIKVIPTRHPAWIMRMNWEWFYVGQKDLKKVAAEMVSRDRVLIEPEPCFITGPSLTSVMSFMLDIAANPTYEWNIDIETRGDTITCFAISSTLFKDRALCIPIQTTTGPYWTLEEECLIWRRLDDCFRLNPKCMNQNLPYDLHYFLSDYRIEPSGLSFDTMIGQKFLYPEMDKGLDFTTSLYTNISYYKDEGKTWKRKTPDKDVWHYNCKDVWATPKVAKAIRTQLSEAGMLESCTKRAQRFLPIALEMQLNRLKVDTKWKQTLEGLLIEEQSKVHVELTKLIGFETVNVRSRPQVAKILYEDLRLPVKKKRGTDTATTEENTLKELRASTKKDSDAFKILNAIIAERHLRTRRSNYIHVELDPDGYWPFSVSINNDKTGRWESKKSPKWRGTKAGHIPKVMRLMFEPPAGRLFVQRDLSQGEARYVGAEARCNFLNKVFSDYDTGKGPKIHVIVGKLCWGFDPVEDSIEYDASKGIVHAYNYMMGFKRLAIEANLQLDDAKRVYSTYGSQVPEIPRWHARIKDEATRYGKLITPTGRIRQCFAACSMVANTGELADEILRDLVSWKAQATIPDILNEGMFTTWDELEWVWFHQHGHDSHLDSIPSQGRLEEYADKTEVFHRVPVIIDREIELVIPSDLKWGYLWGALKPYKPGDRGTREEWQAWCDKEKVLDLEKVKKQLYAML